MLSSAKDDDEEIDSEDDMNENEDDDQEVEQKAARNGPPKRKLEMADYPNFMAKRFAAFQLYRDATLQKWYDKTRLTTGKNNKVKKKHCLSTNMSTTCRNSLLIDNLNVSRSNRVLEHLTGTS